MAAFWCQGWMWQPTSWASVRMRISSGMHPQGCVLCPNLTILLQLFAGCFSLRAVVIEASVFTFFSCVPNWQSKFTYWQVIHVFDKLCKHTYGQLAAEVRAKLPPNPPPGLVCKCFRASLSNSSINFESPPTIHCQPRSPSCHLLDSAFKKSETH